MEGGIGDGKNRESVHVDSNFLSQVTFRHFGPIDMVMVSARYCTALYDRADFDILGVHFPYPMRQAASKRQAEFLAGRAVVKFALESLGHPADEVLSGLDRAPIWPSSLRGSLSHASGRCVCIVVRDPRRAVGVDIEKVPDAGGLSAILHSATSNEERAMLIGDDGKPDARMVTLLFSAKETLFKMLYPTVREYFGFRCAALHQPFGEGSLQLRLTRQLHSKAREGEIFDVTTEDLEDFVQTWAVRLWPSS